MLHSMLQMHTFQAVFQLDPTMHRCTGTFSIKACKESVKTQLFQVAPCEDVQLYYPVLTKTHVSGKGDSTMFEVFLSYCQIVFNIT